MTIILLSSWSATSQIGIPEPDIKIKRSVAIETVKDLERFDGLKVQYDLLENKLAEMVKIIQSKDASIQECKQTQGRLNQVISNFSAMEKSSEIRYDTLKKKYKREVRAGRFKLLLLGGAIAYGIYQSIK